MLGIKLLHDLVLDLQQPAQAVFLPSDQFEGSENGPKGFPMPKNMGVLKKNHVSSMLGS